ncbi:MAG: patatin-like phospholipase family protein [Treponemataceae bacterium]
MDKKSGIVLEGGAMRGLFTAGILDVFMENDIKFDGAIGVSAGGAFGCNFKSKQIGRTLRYNKRFCRDKRYCSLWSYFTTGNLYGADFCYNMIPNQLDIFDTASYMANPMAFYIVASDCNTGLPVYKELKNCNANDLTWMRAGASMPLVSRIVEVDGYKLLDGGITDSIPLKYFESLGYNKNVVILTQPRNYIKKPSKMLDLLKFSLRNYPKIFEAIKNRHNIYNSQRKYIFDKADNNEIFLICPKENLKIRHTSHDPDEIQRVYDEGRLAATSVLQNVKDFLNQRTAEH